MNLLFPQPRPHHSNIDEQECACGAQYADFRAYPDFAEAANLIRIRAKADGDEGGGFRSRGPVLWVMRCMKLDAWYMEHFGCHP